MTFDIMKRIKFSSCLRVFSSIVIPLSIILLSEFQNVFCDEMENGNLEGNKSVLPSVETEPESQTTTSFHASIMPHAPAAYEVLFICIIFGIGAVIRSALQMFNFHLSYTVVIFLFGFAIGWIGTEHEDFHDYTNLSSISPKMLLLVFLPALLFKTAFAIDSHTFLRGFWQILILAVPGFLISAMLIATAMMFMFDYEWVFTVSLLFGVLASATYPNEVIVLLKELGQSKHLSNLLEGESLLCDGSTIIMFNILLQSITLHSADSLQIFISLIRYAVGGPVLGLLIGRLTSFLLSYLFNDPVANVTLTIVAAYSSFFLGEEVLKVSGVLAVVVLGVILSAERSNLAPEIDALISNVWEVLTFLTNTLVFIMVGIVTAENVILIFELKDVIVVLITYIICTLSRILMFIIIAPIISRLGYGLPWRSGLIASWGGLRGAVSLCLALTVLHTEGVRDVGAQFIIHVSALVILTLVINGCTTNLFLKLLGMSDISLAKKTNMNNAMKYLENMRDRSIGMLKMDRFLADSNWIFVEEGTRIKHPYKIQYEEDEDEDGENYMGYHFTTCPDCQKEVINNPTAHEFKEMSKEAKLRILKTKKVSYWRQFEHGMLSKEGVRMLVGAVEMANDREDPILMLEDFKFVCQQKGVLFYVRKKLIGMISGADDGFINPPRQRWRKISFEIATNKWFDISIYIVIVLNAIPIIVALDVNPTSGSPASTGLKVCNLVFFLIYLAEFIIKVSAFGFKLYIKSHWNKLDLFTLCVSLFDLVLDCMDAFTEFDKASSKSSIFTKTAMLFRIIRLTRLIKVLRASIPKLLNLIDARIDARMSLSYDIGKGFVTGEEEVLKQLPHIIDNTRIMDELKMRAESDRLTVTKQLGMMQRDRPWIAITVKTRQAVRSILNNMKDAVFEMKDGGLLDEVEYLKLMTAVDNQLKYLAGHMKTVEPCPPKVLFKEVPWLLGDEIVAEYMLEHAELVSFNYGDSIVSVNEVPEAIYIIVSGLVKLVYIPNEASLENLAEYGALPNVDYITSLRFDEKQEDYIVSGNVIGELGVLTNRTYDTTITCDTAVQAYRVSLIVMREAFLLSNDVSQGLRARMWKVVSTRIASVVLTNVPAYQSWSQEKIKFHLERAFVPTLYGYRTFVVNDLMEDVLLIEGQIMDASTRLVYFAPAYIPRTVHLLLFPNSSMMNVETNIETKLLIIPTKDVDEYDVMDNEDTGGEMVSLASSRCLQHSVASRMSSRLGANFSKSRVQSMTNRGKIRRRRTGFQPSSAGISMKMNNIIQRTTTSTKSMFSIGRQLDHSSSLTSGHKIHPESVRPDNVVIIDRLLNAPAVNWSKRSKVDKSREEEEIKTISSIKSTGSLSSLKKPSSARGEVEEDDDSKRERRGSNSSTTSADIALIRRSMDGLVNDADLEDVEAGTLRLRQISHMSTLVEEHDGQERDEEDSERRHRK